MLLPRLPAVPFLLVAALSSPHAATVTRVDISGLDEAMAQNVRDSLSLVEAIGKQLSERRLAYLVRGAEAETREALEPFGYYSAKVEVQQRPAAQEDSAGAVAIRIDVSPGTAVRVRRSHVAITGEGGTDSALQRDVAVFSPVLYRFR